MELQPTVGFRKERTSAPFTEPEEKGITVKCVFYSEDMNTLDEARSFLTACGVDVRHIEIL